MNQIIKFRGKGTMSKQWVTGDLIHGVGRRNGCFFILPNIINLAYIKNCHPLDGVEVDQASVGQYLGYLNYPNEPIYHGDILEFYYVNNREKRIEPVTFSGTCAYVGRQLNFLLSDLYKKELFKDVKIIGNVFDNPELLK